MVSKILVSVVLLCTFGSAFLIATALFDQVCKQNGFYVEGNAVSRTWEE